MKLKKIGILWLIIPLFNGCGQNIQPDDYASNYVPNNEAAQINFQLGREYMQRGRNDIALNKLQKALTLDKNHAYAHHDIAFLYDRLGVNQKARHHYQTAVALRPQDSDIQNNYGQFLCKQGQWTEAEKHFLKALENPVYSTPENPYTNAGLCALQHNKPTEAETYFRHALQKKPNFPVALYQMAQLNFKQRHYQIAYDYLQRYEKVAKPTPKSLLLSVHLARALSNREAEINYALSLRRNFPDAVETQQLNQSQRQRP